MEKLSKFLARILSVTFVILIGIFLTASLLFISLPSYQGIRTQKEKREKEEEEKLESSVQQNINELLTCTICYNNFSSINKPLLLICGHTFCAECLSSISERNHSTRLKCPFCQIITNVPKEGLVTNYILEPVISKEEKHNRRTVDCNQRDTISAEVRRKKRQQVQAEEETQRYQNTNQVYRLDRSYLVQFQEYFSRFQNVFNMIVGN